ncbi:MAG: RNA-binding S4 domain-containing protein [Pseudomonadota bacterium]
MSEPTQRIDKWLWCARFFKTRAVAANLCKNRRVRVRGQVIGKAHHALRPGDVLTFPQGPHIRVVRVAALGWRRGPAREARGLYEDLAPPPGSPTSGDAVTGRREPGAGRPTKAERRALDRLVGEE